MNKTKIEWCRNPDGTQGYTWNPITGCLNHINGMCKGGNFPCYAYRLAHGRLKERYLANENIAPSKIVHSQELYEQDIGEQLHDPFYPRFWPERCLELDWTMRIKYDPTPSLTKDLPLINGSDWKKGRKGIFVCDMSDLFGIGIPEDWTMQVLEQIKISRQHRFYLLTKQPQNLPQWSPFPPNVYLGVSATNQEQFDRAVKYLKEVKATVKFISFEPLLGGISVDL